MAISAMTDFMRRPCSSGWASCRALSASAPAARKASRHSVRVAAVTPYFRLVDSRSVPRSSSRTTLALRLADHRPLPPRPVSASRAGRPPGSLCGPGNRNIHVGHTSLLLSQISVQRNRAAGELKIDAQTPLDISTDGQRLIVAPAATSERRAKFDSAQEWAHRRYGKAFKRLAE